MEIEWKRGGGLLLEEALSGEEKEALSGEEK